MNGPENLRGVDYQISYALLHLLRCLLHEGQFPEALALEDLSDEGADMRLEWEAQPRLHVQVKKVSEGYQWTLARLAAVLAKFCQGADDTGFLFVSNGPGNRDVTKLKRAIQARAAIPTKVVNALASDNCSRDRLGEVFGRLQLWTRCYPSDDDSDPARGIRQEIARAIGQSRFRLSRPVDQNEEPRPSGRGFSDQLQLLWSLGPLFVKPNVACDHLGRNLVTHRACKVAVFPKLPTP